MLQEAARSATSMFHGSGFAAVRLGNADLRRHGEKGTWLNSIILAVSTSRRVATSCKPYSKPSRGTINAIRDGISPGAAALSLLATAPCVGVDSLMTWNLPRTLRFKGSSCKRRTGGCRRRGPESGFSISSLGSVIPSLTRARRTLASWSTTLGDGGVPAASYLEASQRFDRGLTISHTCAMKTAVSIPDEIFGEAEKLADELGLSRSALYARALDALLREHRENDLLEEINAVCARVDTSLDPRLGRIEGQAVRVAGRGRSR